MTLLSRLRAKSRFTGNATATVATVATVGADSCKAATKAPSCVAKVASVAVASAAIQKAQMDPDRYCWPHSDAMNTGEIEVFKRRVVRFIDRGLSRDEASRMADKLVLRDRDDSDDREACLECHHLRGMFCRNHRSAQIPEHLGRDLITLLQRCPGFSPELYSPVPTT